MAASISTQSTHFNGGACQAHDWEIHFILKFSLSFESSFQLTLSFETGMSFLNKMVLGSYFFGFMYTCMTSQNFRLHSFLLSANYACTCTDMSLKFSWGTTECQVCFREFFKVTEVTLTLSPAPFFLAFGWTSLQADCLISLRASSNASASSLPMPTSMPTTSLGVIHKWRQHSRGRGMIVFWPKEGGLRDFEGQKKCWWRHLRMAPFLPLLGILPSTFPHTSGFSQIRQAWRRPRFSHYEIGSSRMCCLD